MSYNPPPAFLCPQLRNKLPITEVKRSTTTYNSRMIERLLTCSCAAARWDPPGGRKQCCHHLFGKQRDISLYLQQVEDQGERCSDREENETAADQVGRPDAVQRAIRVAEHRGYAGHHFFNFGC